MAEVALSQMELAEETVDEAAQQKGDRKLAVGEKFRIQGQGQERGQRGVQGQEIRRQSGDGVGARELHFSAFP